MGRTPKGAHTIGVLRGCTQKGTALFSPFFPEFLSQPRPDTEPSGNRPILQRWRDAVLPSHVPGVPSRILRACLRSLFFRRPCVSKISTVVFFIGYFGQPMTTIIQRDIGRHYRSCAHRRVAFALVCSAKEKRGARHGI
nr:hypothetical protein [Pandoravirus massiliensis]